MIDALREARAAERRGAKDDLRRSTGGAAGDGYANKAQAGRKQTDLAKKVRSERKRAQTAQTSAAISAGRAGEKELRRSPAARPLKQAES